jgi:hypothetical protein
VMIDTKVQTDTLFTHELTAVVAGANRSSQSAGFTEGGTANVLSYTISRVPDIKLGPAMKSVSHKLARKSVALDSAP